MITDEYSKLAYKFTFFGIHHFRKTVCFRKLRSNTRVYSSGVIVRSDNPINTPKFFYTVAEFIEFERRFKFKPRRFKPALNLNRVLADLNRGLNSLNSISDHLEIQTSKELKMR